MAISSNTKFKIYKIDPFNAHFKLESNLIKSVIEVGTEIFTIETFVHEIIELETVKLLFDLNKQNKQDIVNPIIKMDGYINSVAHFLSPYGENSLIYPFHKNLEEKLFESNLTICELVKSVTHERELKKGLI